MNGASSRSNSSAGSKLVSIGVPIYKRLEYLPNLLQIVNGQDYPAIELIVSDNGENGSKVRDLVTGQYPRPHRFRQNPSTVDVVTHHNQIINAATGDYFFLLSDDDEISPNFISELAHELDLHPEASLAYARQEIVAGDGTALRQTKATVPDKLSGPDFIRAMWGTYEYGYENLEGFLTRTALWQGTGGYPHFARGNHIDNAAVVRLCLGHAVVFNPKCAHRHRVVPQSFSWSSSMKELALASTQFMRWLDTDPTVQEFAAKEPQAWRDVRAILVRMAWETYLWRWKDVYRHRLSAVQWAREAFRMPYIPAYYRQVRAILRAAATSRVKSWLLPSAKAPPEDAVRHPADPSIQKQ